MNSQQSKTEAFLEDLRILLKKHSASAYGDLDVYLEPRLSIGEKLCHEVDMRIDMATLWGRKTTVLNTGKEYE